MVNQDVKNVEDLLLQSDQPKLIEARIIDDIVNMKNKQNLATASINIYLAAVFHSVLCIMYINYGIAI